jgi:hypothetical protein
VVWRNEEKVRTIKSGNFAVAELEFIVFSKVRDPAATAILLMSRFEAIAALPRSNVRGEMADTEITFDLFFESVVVATD